MASKEYHIQKCGNIYQWIRTDGLMNTYTSGAFRTRKECADSAKQNAVLHGWKAIIIN